MEKNNFFLIRKKNGIKYSLLSGDSNKIHINSSYGYNSIFGTNICHGTLVILNFLKKIKFNNKNNFYMDIIFKYPFFYDRNISIQKKINKKNIKYYLIQDKREKAQIILDLSNDTTHNFEKIKSKNNFLKKIKNNKNEIKTILNTLSMYVGTINPGDKSLISNIKIFYNKGHKRKNKNIISVDSKILKKGYPIINNYLKFNSYNVNFESLIRPDIKKANTIIPKYLRKIIENINYNVLIIGASQGIGKYFFDILKINKKIIKIATYNKNIIKTKSKKIVVKKLDVLKEKKVLDELIKKYSPLKIYYFPTSKIYFDNRLSKEVIDDYNKIFIEKPLEILKKNRNKKIKFFYPSTTNIEINKNSVYSKIKLTAEKKIKEICHKFKIDHHIYRFPAILSRQSVSVSNPRPPNLIEYINKNKKVTKILF
tara:strand:+ start:292 stop:1566 length:1275 start_codon:yes stop_codon:yes gene_type:complete